jgi:hypothetical protein
MYEATRWAKSSANLAVTSACTISVLLKRATNPMQPAAPSDDMIACRNRRSSVPGPEAMFESVAATVVR